MLHLARILATAALLITALHGADNILASAGVPAHNLDGS